MNLKKIVGILIMMLLITITIPVSGLIKEKNQDEQNFIETKNIILTDVYIGGTSKNMDELDQIYPMINQYGWHIIGNSTKKLAQTFKPSYPTITRLSLYLKKYEGTPQYPSYMSYMLRLNSGLPGGNGNEIDRIYIDIEELYTGSYRYEFDIVDSAVLPGGIYHIELYGVGLPIGTSDVTWGWGYEEPYTNGNAYYLSDGVWNVFEWLDNPCNFCFSTFGTDFGGNHGPNKPSTPSGPSTGRVGESYSYSTSSTDLDGDQIRYGFDWYGDGIINFITAFVNSGESFSQNNTWFENGTYQVRVKAIDEHGRYSEWSDPLEVSMPKSKSIIPFGFIFVFGYDVDTKFFSQKLDKIMLI
jgi:hypothetical protein